MNAPGSFTVETLSRIITASELYPVEPIVTEHQQHALKVVCAAIEPWVVLQ
jgi:hypothetical protein